MRLCIIGKFPPIQGGVSMRTYWTAHALAARGHEVHVLTNAREVDPPFRMYMRAEDWQRCGGVYGAGSVTVHWTDPVDASQSYIPMASAFVTKLAALAARLHARHPLDVIYTHYLEPYGVAGHLAAQMTGVPQVARMAGSDAGRLWRHPQLEAVYDHVLRSAAVVIAEGAVAARAVEHGVDPGRIAAVGGFVVPEDIFTPRGPVLDLAALRAEIDADPGFRPLLWGDFPGDRPYFGVYGKLGDRKGSFALLAAMARLEQAGLSVGLVALAHAGAGTEHRFRTRAEDLGLARRILQLPFMPHWRVPAFLRGCLAVCCLEQDFPIGLHQPIVPREVLLCGTCLVGAAEVIRKLPGHERLPSGYGCVEIADVNDVEVLTERLAAIVRDPGPADAVGARGHAFARDLQSTMVFPQRLEHVLEAAAARRRTAATRRGSRDADAAEAPDDGFPLTRIAAAAFAEHAAAAGWPSGLPHGHDGAIDLERARRILAAIDRATDAGRSVARPLAMAVKVEIAIAAAQHDADREAGERTVDAPARLRIARWAMAEGDLVELVPIRHPDLRIVSFDHDIAAYLQVRTAADLPAMPERQTSYLVVFGRSAATRRDPVVIDAWTAGILHMSDGSLTVAEITGRLHPGDPSAADRTSSWIENLFQSGLIFLTDTRRKDSDRPVA